MHYTSKAVYEFISQKNNDPIVEWKTCTISGTAFPIYQSDLTFYDKVSPVINGVKYQISTPTLCPEERQRRRMLFRNERKLYRRKCGASGKDIISMYSPDKNYKVYDQKYRWSDQWNPMDFGRDFDFSKTFLEQYSALFYDVPMRSLTNDPSASENSEYVNNSWKVKNCYMVFATTEDENCYYGNKIYFSKDSVDNSFLMKSNRCFETIHCTNCDNISYSILSTNCQNSAYLVNCINCSFCIKCNNLVNKKYCIENIQYTKEEYEERIRGTQLSKDWDFIKDNCFLQAGLHALATEKTLGCNIVQNTKNCIFTDISDNLEDCKYLTGFVDANDCMDGFSRGEGASRCYEMLEVGGNASNTCFCISSRSNIQNLFYSSFCSLSTNLFGCVSLRNKEYCILNKQYTKEEYEILVPKIIEHMKKTGEWGEFFDPNLSPFGYNETVAQDFMPLTREEAIARGYKWQDKNYDPVIPEGADTLKGDLIPSDISTVTDDILKKIFICEVSGRPFRLVKQELEFYRKYSLPLPRKHPDVRHEERMKLRPGRELHLRTCDQCGVEMVSVYSQEYQGKVYCESCYQKTIY